MGKKQGGQSLLSAVKKFNFAAEHSTRHLFR